MIGPIVGFQTDGNYEGLDNFGILKCIIFQVLEETLTFLRLLKN